MVQLHSLALSTCLSWTCGWLRLPMPKRTALLLANGAYTLLGGSLWQVIESQSHFSGTHFHKNFQCRNNVLRMAFFFAVCDLCIVMAWNWGSGHLYHDLSPCRPPWQRSWRPRFSMFIARVITLHEETKLHEKHIWKKMSSFHPFQYLPGWNEALCIDGDGVTYHRWWTSKSGLPMTRTCKVWRHRNVWTLREIQKIYENLIFRHSMESLWNLNPTRMYTFYSFTLFLPFSEKFMTCNSRFWHFSEVCNSRKKGGHRGVALWHCWHGLWAPWRKEQVLQMKTLQVINEDFCLTET